MSDVNINTAAQRFSKRVTDLVAGGRTWRDAFDLAQVSGEAGAQAYRLVGVGSEMKPEPESVVSLSSRADEDFDAVAMRVATEQGISLRDAIHLVGQQRPDLAAARG